MTTVKPYATYGLPARPLLETGKLLQERRSLFPECRYGGLEGGMNRLASRLQLVERSCDRKPSRRPLDVDRPTENP